jgi:hypothetical protein
MKLLIVGIMAIGLSGCGSFKKVVESNKSRKTEHMQFQVNRLSAVDKCYQRATTDNQFGLCAMMQMQLQTEQGFTVRADLDGLPETPENQLKSTAMGLGKLAVVVKLGEKLIDSLNRPNDIVDREVPVIIDREVPLVIDREVPVSLGE